MTRPSPRLLLELWLTRAPGRICHTACGTQVCAPPAPGGSSNCIGSRRVSPACSTAPWRRSPTPLRLARRWVLQTGSLHKSFGKVSEALVRRSLGIFANSSIPVCAVHEGRGAFDVLRDVEYFFMQLAHLIARRNGKTDDALRRRYHIHLGKLGFH